MTLFASYFFFANDVLEKAKGVEALKVGVISFETDEERDEFLKYMKSLE